MLVVGLTGGIGCGKSTVTRFFQECSVPVVDADDIAHAIVQPGQPTLAAIVDTFG
ncbi:MAG: dephospho-CoA kinase, partial [Cycloclasticus sp.]|nr:dephospho-CoA kinase [Cycloclasticus sp.]